jgi:hypothetical protein
MRVMRIIYCYNARGTGSPLDGTEVYLGLGWSEAEESRTDTGGIKESRVTVPSDMIAVGEGTRARA